MLTHMQEVITRIILSVQEVTSLKHMCIMRSSKANPSPFIPFPMPQRNPISQWWLNQGPGCQKKGNSQLKLHCQLSSCENIFLYTLLVIMKAIYSNCSLADCLWLKLIVSGRGKIKHINVSVITDIAAVSYCHWQNDEIAMYGHNNEWKLFVKHSTEL